MTAISSVANLTALPSLLNTTRPDAAAAVTETAQVTPYASTSVTLGQVSTPSPVYSLGKMTQDNSQGILSVKTASGAQVELSESSDGSGIQLTVKQGTLSEAERSALEKLSGAFQKTMDGLTGQPPRLDLDALTRFSSTVITSVDLSAKVEGTSKLTLAFHADSTVRTLKSTGTLGTVDISVDMSKRALFGSENQQQRAINQYLKQFDRAESRGNGNSTLMTMFKDAFSALNSHYSDSAAPATGRQQTIYLSLTRSDSAMMTGLADFSASVSQTPAMGSNPVRLNEVDTFSYQVSQTSTLTGQSDLNRTVTQQQQSHLTASYHRTLTPGLQLNLTSDKHSQNYAFYQIDDKAESTTGIEYRKGELVAATLDQSASTSTRVQKYVQGWLESDTTTPEGMSTSKDLLAQLQSAWQSADARISFADYLRQQTLPDFGGAVLLESAPQAL